MAFDLQSASNAGDVNGDGFDDIIVGQGDWGEALSFCAPRDVVPEPAVSSLLVIACTGVGIGWRRRTGRFLPRFRRVVS